MCRSILFLLVVFTFVQIQIRWKRDSMILVKSWNFKTLGNTYNLSNSTGNIFQFVDMSDIIRIRDNVISIKDKSPVEIHGIVNIIGPSLSFHRVVLTSNDIVLRTVNVQVPYIKSVSIDFLHRFEMKRVHNIQVKHYFDHGDGGASAHIDLGFRLDTCI
jgi:hypothetical protein